MRGVGAFELQLLVILTACPSTRWAPTGQDYEVPQHGGSRLSQQRLRGPSGPRFNICIEGPLTGTALRSCRKMSVAIAQFSALWASTF